MKRRTFLKAAASGATVGIAAGASPVVAAGKRRLKMVTTWPKNFPGLGTGAERLARRISEASDGTLQVRVFAAGELVPAFSAFDAVAGGAADMYHGGDYYWQGKSRAYNFFSSVPFGMTASEMAAWVYFGGGQELWDGLSAPFGIKPFMAGNTGVQMGGWFRHEITSLDDFKGLRMRMPGLGGEVLRRLGAAAVSLPAGEIFPALQSGAIDATEWVGPWNDLAFGFHKIVKYYYYPGFHEPGTSVACGINLGLWNDLSKPQQAIVRDALAAENDMVRAEFNARNAIALKVLIEKHGVKLRRFSDAIVTELARLSAQVLKETAAADATTGKIYDSYRAFLADSLAWDDVAEKAYGEARRLFL